MLQRPPLQAVSFLCIPPAPHTLHLLKLNLLQRILSIILGSLLAPQKNQKKILERIIFIVLLQHQD